jgi:hypothetical protein
VLIGQDTRARSAVLDRDEIDTPPAKFARNFHVADICGRKSIALRPEK